MARGPWPRSGVRTRLPVVWKRPANKLHPDAADWVTRVIANGGTVSASTAAAVNQFCVDIEAASLRDRFYRLNLFCGGTSGTAVGLNSALVPLYRGPSLGGTQYGAVIDGNQGPFVGGNYAENAGLTAPASSTAYLDTGLQTISLPAGVVDSGHLSAWHGAFSAAVDTDPILAGMHNGATDRVRLQLSVRAAISTADSGAWGKANVVTSAVSSGARTSGFKLVQRTSPTNLEFWKNASVDAVNTTSTTGIAGASLSLFVFRMNNSGSPLGDQPGVTIRHYSVGDDMTSGQVNAFYAALSAFNTAMGRA